MLHQHGILISHSKPACLAKWHRVDFYGCKQIPRVTAISIKQRRKRNGLLAGLQRNAHLSASMTSKTSRWQLVETLAVVVGVVVVAVVVAMVAL
jgi:hypothetical protein